MFKKIAATLAFAVLFAHSAVNYPYPQAKSYGNSTINASTVSSTTLKTRFNDFRDRFYEEGNCSGTNDCARIKFDTPTQTVSEGIAYGMLMMVYFSDNTTDYQTQFDKLWKYYRKWTNKNGLMSWKIEGFSRVSSEENASNSASDAEFDAAVALVMAHYQFGNTTSKNYLDTAKALIATIRQQEISPNNLHKPGDAWDEERNPSYISPAAFEIFKEVESLSTAKSKWGSVITANYSLLTSNQSKSSSGLFSDWCADDGSPITTNNKSRYHYDAARIPWRLAWANAWYGHSDAKTLLGKVVTYLGSRSASSTGFDDNATFVGPFMNAFSYSSSNQSKMNDYGTRLIDFSGQSYYNTALQVLTGLLASGNMPNLKALKGDNCCTGGGTTSGTQIDKLEKAANETDEERNYARTWEPWYVFTDASSDNGEDGRGASTISNGTFKNIVYNKTAKKCEEITDYKVVIKDGNDWVVKIDNYSLSAGSYKWDPYAAIGLDAVNNGSTYNLSSCTGGFKYKYKGAKHNFKVQLKTVKDFNYHYMQIPTASTAWTDVEVPTSELTQESWGDKVNFSLGAIEAFTWEVKGGLSTTTGSLAIKEFHCIGGSLTFPAERPASQCSGGNSSSSRAGGSSSSSVGSGGGGGSSSSIGSGGGSSSSSVGGSSSSNTTPIISLSHYAASNGAFAIKNGVNLQVLKNASMEVFGLNGKPVRSHEFSNGSYSIMLGDLPKGLYIVKVQFGNQREILRVPVR
jgi:hypothetical protein